MESIENALSLVDFSYPGLEDACKAYESNDHELAFNLVVEHFRNRKYPKYLFDRETASFIDSPLVFEEAEKTMRHFIFGHQFDGPIVWNYNPTADTSRDNEWTWSLYRTIYWQPLARAYALTGDERYVREFVSQFKGFYEFWPAKAHIENTEFELKTPFPGHAWRTIEAGIRIYTTWLPCLEIFRKSESLDDAFWACFLSSINDHATFLMGHYSNHNRSSNWLSMEASALLQMGIMFPELKGSQVWKDTGHKRVMHEIPYCFDSDGVHMERTPIYHLVASIAFLQAVLLCRNNGIYVPDYAMSVIEKSAEFLLRIVKPDFSTPMLGDADRDDFLLERADTSTYEGMNLSFFPDDLNEIRGYFSLMARLTGRKDFLFLATGGKEGCAPENGSSALLEAGIFATRTGMRENDSFLMTQMIRLERGERSTHSHNDTGHVELMLDGEDILIDCGRYIYNSSIWKDWRHYFTSVKAHNTLYVDDHNMGDVPEVQRVRGVRGVVHEFTDNGAYRVIDISHNGYVFMDDPVFHRRQIVLVPEKNSCIVVDYVRGEGRSSHDFRFYWNFASENLSKGDGTFVYSTKKGRRYVFSYVSDNDVWEDGILCGSSDPIGGWASFGYPIKQPVAQLCVRSSCKAPFIMASLIGKEDVCSSVSMNDGAVHADIGGIRLCLSEKGVARI